MKKSLSGALVVLLVSMSTLAHAQGTPGDAQTMGQAASATVSTSAPAAANTQWNNDGSAHITRAQVYRELVQAQQDGQLKTLNSTVYAHH
ncbi:DUF4148 domain-containing protein [Paraburkholderia sp. Ac-20340]|uniref:DUF4148 domain-containing protein n=1 Tax=Paraburkholderia sp. Ac-20340 TaxID=2703888 RepID=UPI00197E0DDB|nr:DUF4148 domain-containing protein [Paraburkholderia sp. Ac-20340]MBN3855849.1 DUF4148 domain-containing protein [Paraburkholderia sp. Ac-20340]